MFGQYFDLALVVAPSFYYLYRVISAEQIEQWRINTFANESQFQAAAFQLLNNEFWQFRGVVWHTKNEGKKDMRTAVNDVAEGVLPGVPDLCIKYRGVLFTIELKQPDGVLSPSQKKLHPVWNQDCPRIPVYVARTMYDVYMYALWIIEQNFTVVRDV